MGTTLDHGIYLPDEGERNCYDGLAGNWVALDNHLGSTNIHVTINDKQAWDGHIADTTIHVTSADKQAWNGHVADTTIHVTSADKQAWDGHIADTTIHVTSADKQAWNGKADASALTAHTGNTTIHVTAEDKQAWNGKADASALTAHTGDTTIHVTAEDKAKWDTVTSKADDSAVMHKSGNETIGGQKTFDNNTLIYNSDTNATTPSLYLKSSKIEISPQGNTSGDQNLTWLDKNSTAYAYVKGAIQPNGSAVRIRVFAKDSSDNSVINELQILAHTNGRKAIFPSYSNEIDLGLSSYKWKSFNGLEPSALSLPSGNANKVIDISSYITNLDGTANSYTVPANGWISIAVVGTAIAIVSSSWSDSRLRASSGDVRMLYPVLKNETLNILITGTALAYARFIPCQGNV